MKGTFLQKNGNIVSSQGTGNFLLSEHSFVSQSIKFHPAIIFPMSNVFSQAFYRFCPFSCVTQGSGILSNTELCFSSGIKPECPLRERPRPGVRHDTPFYVLHPLVSESLVPTVDVTLAQENSRKT